jgi:hypothetical protein
MRTRTLLLLAIGCGLAVLVAGMFLLLKLDHQQPATILGVGDTGRAGDAVVKVMKAAETTGSMVVTVQVSGVGDPNGTKPFTLVVPGLLLSPVHGAADECTALFVQPVTCTLTFDTAQAKPGSRMLLFSRAAEKVRWNLVA